MTWNFLGAIGPEFRSSSCALLSAWPYALPFSGPVPYSSLALYIHVDPLSLHTRRWCGKCRQIGPFLDELVSKHPGVVRGTERGMPPNPRGIASAAVIHLA